MNIKKILIACVFSVSLFSVAHAQTTVISHGYNPPTSNQVQGWMLDMANALRLGWAMP